MGGIHVRHITVSDFEASLLIGVATSERKPLWYGKTANRQSAMDVKKAISATAVPVVEKKNATRCKALDALDEGSIHGQHSISIQTGITNSPRWSFRDRHRELTKPNFPGPGAYNAATVDKYKFDAHPNYSMTSSGEHSESKLLRKIEPGPGEYKTKELPKGASVSLGTAIRHTVHGLHRDAARLPGPGQYVVRGGIGDIANSSAGFTLRRKHDRDGLHPESTPSPGAYTSSVKQTKSDQARDIVFRGRLAEPKRTKTPGPGNYEFVDSIGGSVVHETLPKYTLHDRTKFCGHSRIGSASSPGFPHVFRHTVSSPGFIASQTAFKTKK